MKRFNLFKLQLCLVFFLLLANFSALLGQTKFLGLAQSGGAWGGGTMFSINSDGSVIDVLHEFQKDVNPASYGELLQLPDGSLVGMADNGGNWEAGGIFKIFPDGSERVIFTFRDNVGSFATGSLILGTDGKLYGMTNGGGSNYSGTIFRINADGSDHIVLHNFDGSNGSAPNGSLIEASNGSLYGMTNQGGANGSGVIFRIEMDGSGYSILHSFNTVDGTRPRGTLIQGTDDRLYGLTSFDGASSGGTVFSIDVNGNSFEVLYNLNNSDGIYPYGSLTLGLNGKLYGMAEYGGLSNWGTIFSISETDGEFIKLYDFNYSNGARPRGSLILGGDGKLYGLTTIGGQAQNPNGTIFKISLDGTGHSIIHNFNQGSEGGPLGSLIQGADGKLYGMTPGDFYSNRRGKVFGVNLDGSAYAVLHQFQYSNPIGPIGSLIKAPDGKLFGTAQFTGAFAFGAGVLFSVNEDGSNFKVLFDNYEGQYGFDTYSTPLLASNGKLYGMFSGGGSPGAGTIYSIETDGSNLSIIFNFDGVNGSSPAGSLIQAIDGKLYGTTRSGGTIGFGTIFSINADGTGHQILHNFDENGNTQAGSLIQGADGKLYGMRPAGGDFDLGIIFSINTDGSTYTVLHNFDNANGARPNGSLTQALDGTLYGMTYNGGASGLGTLFSIQSDGTNHTLLHSFSGPRDVRPNGSLLIHDSKLYGYASNAFFSFDLVSQSYTKVADVSSQQFGSPLAIGEELPVCTIDLGLPVSPTASTICYNTSTTIEIANTQVGVTYQLINGYNDAPVGAPIVGTGGMILLPTGNLPYYDNTTLDLNDNETGFLARFKVVATSPECVVELVQNAVIEVEFIPTGGDWMPSLCSDYSLNLNLQVNAFAFSSSPLSTFVWSAAENPNVTGETITPQTSAFITDHLINTSNTTQVVIYTITATSVAGGCTGPSWDITAHVNPNPIGGDDSKIIANGEGVNYSLQNNINTLGNGLEFTSFTWSAAPNPNVEGLSITPHTGETISDVLNNISTTPQLVTYTVLPRHSTGCPGDAFLVLVTVNPDVPGPPVFVTSPGNNSMNLNTSLNVTAKDVGALTYTIQLSTDPNFSTIDFEASGGSRTQAFSGLSYNTVYYNRVMTDLSPVFGEVRSFTTRTAESITYVTSPGNNATNLNTSLNVTAKDVAGALTYTIQLSNTSDFSTIDFESTGARTQAFSGLSYNTVYYNRVMTDLSPEFGEVRSFTTRTAESITYVTSPGNSATNLNASLNVTAKDVAGALTYTIQLSTTSDFSAIDFESTGDRTQAFSGLSYNTVYYNRVMTNLSPEFGEIRSFTTRTAESITYVTSPGNSATNLNTSLNVTAKDVAGALTYTIQLSTTPDFSTIDFESIGARTQAFSGLSYNTVYYNRVMTDLSPAFGEVRSFTTRTAESITYVSSPGNNATNLNTSLNVTAKDVAGALTYTIQLSTTPDFSTIDFESTGARTQAFSGLSYNTVYYNRVMTDLSPTFGEVRSFTTRTAESITYVTSPGNGASNVKTSVNVTSKDVPGATEYTIQLSESADFSTVAFENTGPSRTLLFSGLTEGTTYYNRVRTDLSILFGEVRSFTTKIPVPSGARIASEQNSTDELIPLFITNYQNPFIDRLVLQVKSGLFEQVELGLIDQYGKTVHTSTEKTNSLIEVETTLLSAGVYILVGKAGVYRETIRIIKIN